MAGQTQFARWVTRKGAVWTITVASGALMSSVLWYARTTWYPNIADAAHTKAAIIERAIALRRTFRFWYGHADDWYENTSVSNAIGWYPKEFRKFPAGFGASPDLMPPVTYGVDAWFLDHRYDLPGHGIAATNALARVIGTNWWHAATGTNYPNLLYYGYTNAAHHYIRRSPYTAFARLLTRMGPALLRDPYDVWDGALRSVNDGVGYPSTKYFVWRATTTVAWTWADRDAIVSNAIATVLGTALTTNWQTRAYYRNIYTQPGVWSMRLNVGKTQLTVSEIHGVYDANAICATNFPGTLSLYGEPLVDEGLDYAHQDGVDPGEWFALGQVDMADQGAIVARYFGAHLEGCYTLRWPAVAPTNRIPIDAAAAADAFDDPDADHYQCGYTMEELWGVADFKFVYLTNSAAIPGELP